MIYLSSPLSDRPVQNAFHAEVHTNRTAETAGSSIRHAMNKIFRVMQLNVRKQETVHESLMNDEDTQNAVAPHYGLQSPRAGLTPLNLADEGR